MDKESIAAFMAHPLLLFITSFIFSWNCVSTLLKLSYRKEKTNGWVFLFSVVNSFFVVLWSINQDGTHPMALIVFPSLFILDIYLLSRDTWWTYLNFFFLMLLDEFSLYGIASAFVTIFMQNPWPIGSKEHRRVLLTMTFLMAAGIFWSLPRSRKIALSEFSDLFHSPKKNTTLFGIVCSISMVLLTSAMFILTLIYDDSLPRHAHVMINADLFLKNSLILLGSFLVVLFYIWQERKNKKLVEIDSELRMEKQFRENTQEDSIFRFCFDVALGEITEGEWFFRSIYEELDYDTASVLEDFRLNGIHEQDRYHFIPLKELEEHKDKLKIPFHTFNVRMSTAYLRERMDLREGTLTMLKDMDKEWLWTKVQITIVEDEGSGDSLCYVSFTNIDSEMTYSEKLLHEATTDGLTGVYNRAFMERAMKELFESQKSAGTLFMIDMDHFKSVNDTLGHPKGDKVLKEAAGILQAVFRENDMICRLGGDEFCIFVPKFIDESMICKRAEELNRRGRVKQYSEDGSRVIHTSFSIGIAICDGTEAIDSYEELYIRADLALYEAKKSGRDTYRIYSQEMEG
ncbi:MAG: GGDEF domain-containing protein [Lachnospiraceae bacterium]